MSLGAPALPPEIWHQIFGNLDFYQLENMEDPHSLSYWASNADELEANLSNLPRIRLEVNKASSSLLQINSTLRSIIKYEIQKNSLIISPEDLKAVQQNAAGARQAHDDHWSYKSLQVRVAAPMDLVGDLVPLISDHRLTLKSLTVHIPPGLEPWDAHLSQSFWASLASLPQLETFVFRTHMHAAPVPLEQVLHFLSKSRSLRDLTLFGLKGTPPTEWINLKEPACQLRSLHLHGFTQFCYWDFKTLLATSHETLQELTLVFDNSSPCSDGFYLTIFRGMTYRTVQAAFLPCTAIRVLRVADSIHYRRDEVVDPLIEVEDAPISPVVHPEAQADWGSAPDGDQYLQPSHSGWDEIPDSRDTGPDGWGVPARSDVNEMIGAEERGPTDANAEGDEWPEGAMVTENEDASAQLAGEFLALHVDPEPPENDEDLDLPPLPYFLDELADPPQNHTLADGFIEALNQLSVLELCGPFLSAHLFTSLKRSRCKLSQLTLYRTPNFPLEILVNQFSERNPALDKLETLTLGHSLWSVVDLAPTDLSKLQSICQDRHISLRLLDNF